MHNPYLKSPSVAAVLAAVHIMVIVDRSGSMESIRDDAIGGFNTFLTEQQSQPGEATLSLVLFDHQYETPLTSVPLQSVAPLTRETFVPRGYTAMYDAIGRALTDLETQNPERAIVVILTDGQENSSREFSAADVKAKIAAAEKRGWRVVYLAANQDAFAVGGALGVHAANTANFAATGAGVRSAYASASLSTSNYRADSSTPEQTSPELTVVGGLDSYSSSSSCSADSSASTSCGGD